MRNLLVTGGAGFIGTNFVHYWLAKYPNDRIVVLDKLTYAGNISNLEPISSHPSFRFIEGDICDRPLLEELFSEESLDTVIHFAAESHVDRSIDSPEAFVTTNVMGTSTLLNAATDAWTRAGGFRENVLFHHISTDEVYGSLGPDDPAFSESTPYAPNSPYSASKAGSDHLVRAYHHTYGLPTTTSNCSNNYGPYQFPEKLIPLMIINALDGNPLPIYGTGKNIRDWIHVEDHCRGIDLVVQHGQRGTTYTLGGSSELTNIALVARLCQAIDQQFASDPTLKERFPNAPAAFGAPTNELIRHVEDRKGHDWRYAIDISRAHSELGYQPVYQFNLGLARTLAWYLDNEPWWRELMLKSEEWLIRNYSQRASLSHIS